MAKKKQWTVDESLVKAIDTVVHNAVQAERTRCMEIIEAHHQDIDGRLLNRICNIIRGGGDIRDASFVRGGNYPDDEPG